MLRRVKPERVGGGALSLEMARRRKGLGHMAKTIASGVGMTNAWLQSDVLLMCHSRRPTADRTPCNLLVPRSHSILLRHLLEPVRSVRMRHHANREKMGTP